MSKNNMYDDLVEIGIYDKVDVEDTKVFENDIVIGSKYTNDNRKYKIDTGGLTNEEVMMSLLAKQNLHLKKITNILMFFMAITIIGVIVAVLFAIN